MRNKLLVAALGVCLAGCTVAADYFYTQSLFQSRAAENEAYSALNADPHGLYGGYTVEQFGEGYEKPASVFGKSMLDVEIVNQYPELPVGCELACAVSVIKYLGYETDKDSFVNTYVSYDDNFYYDSDMASHGPDPRKVFAGDPFSWGYGCYPEVLSDAMNKFFISSKADCTAVPIYEQLNSEDIEKLIDEGVPIITWATIEMKPLNYRKPSEWLIGETGEVFEWYGNSHTLVLCGYDSTCYYFMDSNDKDEIIPYLKDSFLNRYADNGFKAVIVKKSGG